MKQSGSIFFIFCYSNNTLWPYF